jgi:hypothetical protein
MKIFDILSGGLVEKVGRAADELLTSDEELLEKKNELKKAQLQYSIEEDKEITKRWVSDNEHFTTRLVRPFSLIYMFVLFTIVILFDGNIGEFTIKEAYIPIIESLLVTMVIAYFGSRGIEKVSRYKNER